jgi:hypothetical protein
VLPVAADRLFHGLVHEPVALFGEVEVARDVVLVQGGLGGLAEEGREAVDETSCRAAQSRQWRTWMPSWCL